MNMKWRVFGSTAFIALSAGVCGGGVAVAASDWCHARHDPFGVLFLAAFSAGPAILVSACIAGWLASSVVSLGRSHRLAHWARQGVLGGAAVGGCAAGVWYTALNFELSLPLLAVMVPIGAAVGALSGSVVALYCWRVTRDRNAV
jgi:hypothetical protein